jgi:hypothetical protein
MFDSWKIDSQGAAGFSRNRYLLAVCGTLALAALAALAAIAVVAPTARAQGEPPPSNEGPGAPSKDGVQPVVYEDNPDCQDVAGPGDEWFQLKDDNPGGGDKTVSDGYLSVNLDYHTDAQNEFVDFVANHGVDAVIVKGGQDGDAYIYDPEDAADKNLHAPINDLGPPLRYFDISHVSFCYDAELEVRKTARTTFTRDYDWTIGKTNTADDPIVLTPGQTYNVPYQVTVGLAGHTDSDWAVNGTITVHNPAPVAANGVTVADVISNNITAAVDCNGDTAGTGLPATIPAGGDLTCTYSAALPDGTSRTNTATADSTTFGITEGSGNADVTFGNPTTEKDGCVDVSDDKYGSLGTVCVKDLDASGEYKFTYSKAVGPYTNDQCGDHQVTNVASFVTNTADEPPEGDDSGSDSSTVNIDVRCDGQGCTLTQGYWKTHSEKGPAPYDNTWAELPNGANTPFFNLNPAKSWYQIFWTAPQNGNAFLILAHQYQAAYLNSLNEASVPAAVQTALNQAADLLDNYTAGIPNVNGAVKNTMLQLAGVLKAYNEGATGPGHCSEDSTSSKSL